MLFSEKSIYTLKINSKKKFRVFRSILRVVRYSFSYVVRGDFRTETSGRTATDALVDVDLSVGFVLIYCRSRAALAETNSGRTFMATKTNFILKVQDAKLADVQKALKDANINVVSILEVHKEEA